MGIVTLGADPPPFLTTLGPHTDALSVDTVAPAAIDLPVAFTAKFLWLVEADLVAVMVDQFRAIGGVVTIEAPDRTFPVLEVHRVGNDIRMHLQVSR